MKFLFTVPMKWADGGHPLDVGPQDLIEVEADTEVAARLSMNETLGNDAWCSVLNRDNTGVPEMIAKYYPGKVVNMEVKS